jgi:hypothetical protein
MKFKSTELRDQLIKLFDLPKTKAKWRGTHMTFSGADFEVDYANQEGGRVQIVSFKGDQMALDALLSEIKRHFRAVRGVRVLKMFTPAAISAPSPIIKYFKTNGKISFFMS